MININNYKEIIRTSNGDGTERVEIIGCKIIYNKEEIEADLIFPRVPEVGPMAFTDCTTEEKSEIFTIRIPE